MNMQENVRFSEGLRRRGWTDTEIIDFMIEIESGVIKDNRNEKAEDESTSPTSLQNN